MGRGKRFVSYLRVSTDRQGRSGLGLEAERRAVEDFLNGGRWDLIAEFVEVESGKRDDRPKLAEAMALCRLHNATLVIAKLDRLSRDAAFLLGLQKAGVRFVAADMPEANELVEGEARDALGGAPSTGRPRPSWSRPRTFITACCLEFPASVVS